MLCCFITTLIQKNVVENVEMKTQKAMICKSHNSTFHSKWSIVNVVMFKQRNFTIFKKNNGKL